MNTAVFASTTWLLFMFCLETSSDAFPNAHRRPRTFRHSAQRIPIRSPNFRTPSIKISSFVNVISSGSPSRMRMVRRISLGITTRPRSSMRLTMPVAFTVSFSFLFLVLPLVFAKRGGICKNRFQIGDQGGKKAKAQKPSQSVSWVFADGSLPSPEPEGGKVLLLPGAHFVPVVNLRQRESRSFDMQGAAHPKGGLGDQFRLF